MKTSSELLTRALRVVLAGALLGVAAACGGGGGAEGDLSRFDYPNAVDVGFGDAGYRVFSTGLSEKEYLSQFNVNDFIIDSRGRVVIVGTRTSADREAWVLRLLPDGTPDQSCGRMGWASFTTGGPANPQRVIELLDGGYALSGFLGIPSVWALRSDCHVDTSFGKDGQAVMPAPTPTEVREGVNALALDDLGRLYATAASTMSGRLLVARFTAGGAPDVAFGGGRGYESVSSPDGASPQPAAIAVRPDGRVLIAAAMVYNSQVGHWAGFVQLLNDGSLDTQFGESGFVSVKPSPNFVAVPRSLVLLKDGSAIQGGLTQPGVLVGTVISADAYWLKVTGRGVADPEFGVNGLHIWDASPDKRRTSSNYVTSLLEDERSGGFLSCQNWINNTKVSAQIEAASLQALVQRRSSRTGELDVSFAGGGTGMLPRSEDRPASCVGVRRGADGRTFALLDYGHVGNAVGQTFALVRVAQ